MPGSKKPKAKTKAKTKAKAKSKRVSKKTTYENCKTNIIGQDMRLFKQGKLTQRNKMPVKSRKQAIAIALSMAEKKCKDKKTPVDVRRENAKIKQKLQKDNNKIPLRSSDVRTIITKLKDLKKKNKSREYRTLKINLLSRIVMTSPVSPDIYRVIQTYLRNE